MVVWGSKKSPLGLQFQTIARQHVMANRRSCTEYRPEALVYRILGCLVEARGLGCVVTFETATHHHSADSRWPGLGVEGQGQEKFRVRSLGRKRMDLCSLAAHPHTHTRTHTHTVEMYTHLETRGTTGRDALADNSRELRESTRRPPAWRREGHRARPGDLESRDAVLP